VGIATCVSLGGGSDCIEFAVRLTPQSRKEVKGQASKPVWKKIDQNILGEGQFFGQNVNKPTIIAGVPPRPGTSSSMKSADWRTRPSAPYMGAGGASSMVNLSVTGHSALPSMSSLRQHGSEANLRTRLNAGNGSSASLVIPPGFSSRPGTPSGGKQNWINPLDVHFCRDPVPAGPKSPLGQFELKLKLPSDNASLMGDKKEDEPKELPGSTSPPKSYPSPPQSVKGLERPDRSNMNIDLRPSSSKRNIAPPSNLREVRNASPNVRGPNVPASLPSPAASAPRSSDERQQWGAPVIQDVSAKRDTLTYKAPKRQSLSMDIEDSNKTNFNFFDDEQPSTPNRHSPPRGRQPASPPADHQEQRRQQGPPRGPPPNGPNGHNGAPGHHGGPRGGPHGGPNGGPRRPGPPNGPPPHGEQDGYFPRMNPGPRGDRVLPPNGHGGHHGPPNGHPNGRRPGPPGEERPSSPYGRRPGPPAEDRPSSPFGRRPGPPGEERDRPSSPYGRQRGPPREERPSSPYGRRPGPPADERPASPYGRRHGPHGGARSESPYGQQRRGPPPMDAPPRRGEGERPSSPHGRRPGPPQRADTDPSHEHSSPGGMRHSPARDEPEPSSSYGTPQNGVRHAPTPPRMDRDIEPSSPYGSPPSNDMHHGPPLPLEGEPGPHIRRHGPPPIHIEPRAHQGPPPGAVGARRGGPGAGPGPNHPQRAPRQDDDYGHGLQRKDSEPQSRAPNWTHDGDVQHSNFAAPKQNPAPPTPDSANWPLVGNNNATGHQPHQPMGSPTFPQNGRPWTPPQHGKIDESAIPAPLSARPTDRSGSPMDGLARQDSHRPPPRPPQGHGMDFGLRAPTGVADDFGAGFI
jgi:hypothetical protein